MIQEITKPVVFSFFKNEFRNVYKNYTLEIETNRGFDLIYEGRTFFDKIGRTIIDVANVLRDYAYRDKILIDETQQVFRLSSYFYNYQNSIYPVEKSKEGFVTTNIRLTVDGLSAVTREVTSIYLLPFQIKNDNLINPYNTNVSKVQDLSQICKSISHIPNLPSGDFTLNLSFSISKLYTGNLYLCTQSNGYKLNYDGAGNYVLSIPIISFFNINSANDYVYLSNYNYNETAAADRFEIKVALIDKDCEISDYYISFYSNSTWTTLPITAAVKMTNNCERDEMIGQNQMNKIIWNSTYCEWECHTNWLTDEEYATYITLINSPYIQLFDAKRKRTYFCNITQSDFDYIANFDKKTPHKITFKLVENRENKL